MRDPRVSDLQSQLYRVKAEIAIISETLARLLYRCAQVDKPACESILEKFNADYKQWRG